VAFFITLQNSWNVDVLNGLVLCIWTYETQVMAKRRAVSQIASLTSDQKKLGIDPIYLVAEGVRDTIEKFLMKATTLLETTSRSEVCSQSYGAPKLWESHLA